MKGTCKCGLEYTAPKHCCHYHAKPQEEAQIAEGYYYIKCSDCQRVVKMEEGK